MAANLEAKTLIAQCAMSSIYDNQGGTNDFYCTATIHFYLCIYGQCVDLLPTLKT